jgi:spectinomycin phosphotransferase
MYDEPEGLTQDDVAGALRRHWGIDIAGIEYAPVGFGSYHWLVKEASGKRWFATADRLQPGEGHPGREPDAAFTELQAAFETAAALRDRGLSFVVAPIPGRAGEVLVRIGPEWAVSLYPYMEGSSSGYGDWPDSSLRARAAEIVGQIHVASPPSAVRTWDFAITGRRRLFGAIGELGRPWRTGPYGEPTRELLAASRAGVEALFAHYDQLTEDLAASAEPWVLTHGEPHSANFINGADGELYLIDWDTVRLAPRERDLETIVGDDAAALAAYQRVAGRVTPRPNAVELFRVRWILDEICIYVLRFYGQHRESIDSQTSWKGLREYLTGLSA